MSWQDLRIGARIVWTPDGSPIRDVAPRSKTAVGKYNSRKAGRFLAHRSRGHGPVGGEKLAIMRHEIDPTVFDLRTQHVRFDVVVDGTSQSYIPPLIIENVDGTLKVQHVVGRGLRDAEDRLLKKVEEICREVGWRFEKLRDCEIAPTSDIRANIVSVQAERYATFYRTDLLAVFASLQAAGGTASLGQIAASVGAHRPAVPIIKAMMCQGHIELALDRRLDNDSSVSLVPPRPERKSGFLP